MEIMQFYTYLHCKPDLTPFYVGKGSLMRCHNFSRRNQHHKNIVAKYGRENIQIIVFKKDSEESAFASEKRLIKMLKNAGFDLANKTDGGEGAAGAIRTIETRNKQSDSAKLRGMPRDTLNAAHAARRGCKLTAEHRAKVSKSLIGNKRRHGILHSDEAKKKISASNKGKTMSKETIAKRVATRKMNAKE